MHHWEIDSRWGYSFCVITVWAVNWRIVIVSMWPSICSLLHWSEITTWKSISNSWQHFWEICDNDLKCLEEDHRLSCHILFQTVCTRILCLNTKPYSMEQCPWLEGWTSRGPAGLAVESTSCKSQLGANHQRNTSRNDLLPILIHPISFRVRQKSESPRCNLKKIVQPQRFWSLNGGRSANDFALLM